MVSNIEVGSIFYYAIVLNLRVGELARAITVHTGILVTPRQLYSIRRGGSAVHPSVAEAICSYLSHALERPMTNRDIVGLRIWQPAF